MKTETQHIKTYGLPLKQYPEGYFIAVNALIFKKKKDFKK